MDPSTCRRRFLTAAAAGAAVGIAGCTLGTPDDSEETEPLEELSGVPETVGLETIVDGLDAPLAVAFAPDADRRYLAERDGYVVVHEGDGLRDEPLLDLRDTVETEGECGLLGIALHPEFADDRRLFVRYSAPLRAGMPEDYSHTFVLAEFEVTDDGTRARRGTERTILGIPQRRDFHNAGDLAFGPDGYLYVPVGDSGHGQAAQDVAENLLGSVLRVDVDERPGGRRYGVPDDNPLVGRDGLDEHYAWGFRNPWRLSFDGDDLYVADVGQDSYEEVNLVERGGNYGWNVREGTHCFREDECPDETPEDVRGGEPFIDPIVEYPHEGERVSGVSVIGGHVYRGSALPELDGGYVFGDFIPEGRLFVAGRPEGGDGLWPTATVDLDEAEKLTRLLAFGRDDDGAVYALGTGSEDGGLFRIVPVA